MGVDDGAFSRDDRHAPIVALAMSLPSHVDAVRAGAVRVDGTDGTTRLIELVRDLGPVGGLRAVLIDGAVLGGFNVLDLDRIHHALRLPVVAVTRRPPDFPKIHAALRKWFPRNAERRWSLLRAHRLFPVATGGLPIWAASVGCSRADAAWLIRRSTVQGHWPEPLRLAHLVASAGGGSELGRARIKE